MPRRKTTTKAETRRRAPAEVEILPAEDPPPLPGRKTLVEAEHTIKYSAPVPVTVDQTGEDMLIDGVEYEEQERARRRKKTSKDERDELKREMDKLGVASVSRLKLSIDKYRHSESDDSGTMAEKDYCTKYPVTKDHILNEDYLDVARKYGPGRFWFTLRMDNQIVRQWERKINNALTAPIIQSVNPADPNAPQVITYPMPDANGHQPVGQMTWQEMIKMQDSLFERKLKELKLFRESIGVDIGQQSAQAAVTDPKIAALQLIADNPDVMERIGKGIASTVLGAKHGDGDPWAEVAMEAVKSGQAANMLRSAIDAIFNGINGLFPKPQNGPLAGVQPMAQAPAPQPAPAEAAPVSQESAAQHMTLAPSDALIIQLIGALERNAPLKEAQTIINVAVYRHPELDESIEQLLNMSVDEIMVMLTAYHSKVAEIPHAKQWLETLIGSLAAPSDGQEAPQ